MNKNDEIDEDDITIIWLARDDCRGRFACVFEADERVSYIYIYHIRSENDTEILGAVQVCKGTPDYTEQDIEIRWYDGETKAGVFIRGESGAYFDLVAGWGCPGTYWKTRRAASAAGDMRDKMPENK